jgi:hypothetical protein
VTFEQATIKVAKEKEFAALRDGFNRIFSSDRVGEFLKGLHGKGIRVRDFDLVLNSGVLERLDDELARAGSRKLYDSLTMSDQAQMREFYLSKIEETDPALRAKYQKLYRYY